jgi:hypothetical protein
MVLACDEWKCYAVPFKAEESACYFGHPSGARLDLPEEPGAECAGLFSNATPGLESSGNF